MNKLSHSKMIFGWNNECKHDSNNFSLTNHNVYHFMTFYLYVESLMSKIKSDKRKIFCQVFDCFNFWNVACHINAKTDMYDENFVDADCEPLLRYTIGQDLLFDCENENDSCYNYDDAIYARYGAESMLKLLVISFGNLLDDGNNNMNYLHSSSAVT